MFGAPISAETKAAVRRRWIAPERVTLAALAREFNISTVSAWRITRDLPETPPARADDASRGAELADHEGGS